MTSFIDREKELATIKLICIPSPENKGSDQNESHIVRFLGSGGAGNTHLVQKSDTDLADQFPDGVRLVVLAPLTNPNVIPARVAAGLNVPEQRGWSFLDTLTNY
jgi:predicted ATPase